MLKELRLLAEKLSMEYHFPEDVIFRTLKSRTHDFSFDEAEKAMRMVIETIQSGRNKFSIDDAMKITGLSRIGTIEMIKKLREYAAIKGINPDDIAIEVPDDYT